MRRSRQPPEFLQVGALALGGLTLPEILAARAASGSAGADTSVIMLYQHGGASQLETCDLKPAAPTAYRSVFEPITTCVPGMEICELFPPQARLADRFSLVRRTSFPEAATDHVVPAPSAGAGNRTLFTNAGCRPV